MLTEVAELLSHRIFHHQVPGRLVGPERCRLQESCRDINLRDNLSLFQRSHKHLPNGCQTYDIRSVIEILAIKQLARLLESLHNDPRLKDTRTLELKQFVSPCRSRLRLPVWTNYCVSGCPPLRMTRLQLLQHCLVALTNLGRQKRIPFSMMCFQNRIMIRASQVAAPRKIAHGQKRLDSRVSRQLSADCYCSCIVECGVCGITDLKRLVNACGLAGAA